MNVVVSPAASAVERALRRRRRRRWAARLLILLAVVGGAVYGCRRWTQKATPSTARYVTATAEVGVLEETVVATGTLKGLDAVDVGAEISGRVVRVLVDFNSQVKVGDVLAEIDTEQLVSRVSQQQAQVAAADAQARLSRATARHAGLERDRARQLHAAGLMSDMDLAAAEAEADKADASVASALAQAAVARASLLDAESALSKAVIRSPMDGIVLARLVEPGQTVAASLQSPVLFKLARGLDQLELRVDVDEADVGRVREGMSASFTVDAWPGKSFSSVVTQVHSLPDEAAEVVTYEARMTAPNAELSLRPGMTATATIVVGRVEGAVLVPNAALRFRLPKETKQESGGWLMFRPPRSSTGSAEPTPPAGRGVIYVLEGTSTERLEVEIGATDGLRTEVRDPRVTAGTAVLVDLKEEP